ncbi:ribonuclease HII [Planococcus salinus]|uniref:Ribonuclease HII n=1 Tax=Planococcus salinus TaxID=1848460 RepID=A0A3M8PAA8_9BACL|nr:ribonuclease HII [Planococcus salinus]RNF40618.1 ribonuclease HII [Planococcus salinus]
MESVSQLKEKLKLAETWEPWMADLEKDPRKSVQTLVAAWHRRKKLRESLVHNHQLKERFDGSFKENTANKVAGIDEAGRGPIAGPVVTAAVILPEDCTELLGLDDSKKITKSKRERFAEIIKKLAVSYAVHIQSSEEIDRHNIYQATKLSMAKAAAALSVQPDVVLADAMQLDLAVPCHSVIKGDAKSLCIAAASILAKTERDNIMERYAEEYPLYGFEKHAGYGTKEHVAALELHGPCLIHRKTFEPVKTILAKQCSVNESQ